MCEQRFEEAVEEYDMAISLNPNNPDYHNNKGNTLIYLERFGEADSEYEIAIKLNPNNPDYHNNKGKTLSELKRYEEAAKKGRPRAR